MIEITDKNADQLINATEVPLLIKFHGEGCAACKMLDAPLAEVEKTGLVAIAGADVAECGALANRLGVRGLPLMALFSGGELLGTKSGAASLGQIEAWIAGGLR